MSAPILIVDENDQPVGSATKQDAWRHGLKHRIVRIMIEDGRGSVLLQMRAPDKDIYPSCWDNSVAGHVDEGEDYDTAAYRELEEEVGITGKKLIEVGIYPHNETVDDKIFNQFNKVYKLTMNVPLSEFRLEEGKITSVKWLTIPEAKKLVRDHPDQVTGGFKSVIERYY
jgi:isopentenyldiphosphate isomerase